MRKNIIIFPCDAGWDSRFSRLLLFRSCRLSVEGGEDVGAELDVFVCCAGIAMLPFVFAVCSALPMAQNS